jgi:hypothetical protein
MIIESFVEAAAPSPSHSLFSYAAIGRSILHETLARSWKVIVLSMSTLFESFECNPRKQEDIFMLLSIIISGGLDLEQTNQK